MFPDDDVSAAAREKLLMHVIDAQAETVRFLSRHIHLLETNGHVQDEPRPRKRAYGPGDPRWRTWRGFCMSCQKIEHELEPPLTKVAVATAAGCSEKTLARTMKGYGLQPEQWPPSTWDPNEDREWHSPN